METETQTATAHRHAGIRVAWLLAPLLAAGLVACGGDEAAAPDEASAEGTDAPAVLLEPDPFEARVRNPEALVVNVHVPYEGEIDGTDAFVHFERIAGHERLPADKDSEIILYCRTGRMSLDAAETLREEGYTNLYDLEGGMVAWEKSGRQLIQRSPAPAVEE